MGSGDGDPADDAFAETIAPGAVPTPPTKLATGTTSPEPLRIQPRKAPLPRAADVSVDIAADATLVSSDISADATIAAPPTHRAGVDATLAAPVSGFAAPLPKVDKELYGSEKEIARGGMGRILAAEDRRLGRPVAIKELLEPSGDALSRFQREALITARLQHPGIVPVYEAGQWPSGEPFFAMKLVSGRPLDRVIGDAKTLEDRLALLPRLAAACDAMAYAHKQRIIHRDLKPGNVLIGEFGETVVIDWGLAKDLDTVESFESANRSPRAQITRRGDETDSQSSTLTVAGAVMGTPAYMPPEQARGETLDQRADVFALGAMLYHLLAGVPPYNARTATDVIAAAALGKLVPLTEREKRAPKDLVAIVERAMAPDMHDRYADAGELAAELQRFLTGQLVGAHHYTALQRIARFVRRHRAAVTISAIATIGFAVGGTIAVRRVVAARDEARSEASIAKIRKIAAERLIDYTLTHVQTQLRTIGRLDVLSGLGSEVRHYYDTLAKIPGGMPAEDEIRMVEAIDMIGEAEHTSGKRDQALATWKFALDKVDRAVGTDTSPRTFRLRRMRARLDTEAAGILQERGQLADAATGYEAAKKQWDDLEREQPKDRSLMLDAAAAHDRLGDVLRVEGKLDVALDEYNEAKAERERATTTGNGQVTDEKMALSTSHLKIGSIHQLRGESKLALDEYKLALHLREQLLASQPDNVTFEQQVIDVQSSLADVQRSIGDDDAAIDSYRAALPMTAELVRRDPSNADWQRLRANTLAELGFSLGGSGRFQLALDQLGQAVALQRDLTARDPKSTRYRVDLSRSYTRAGDAYLGLGRTAEGIEQYKLALDIRRELVDKDTKNEPFRRSVAWSYAKLATGYAQSGDVPKALEAHEQALQLRERLVADAPAQSEFKDELATTEVELARLLASQDGKRAAELVSRGVARARALADNDAINTEWKETLVQGLLAQALIAKAAGDEPARRSALDEAAEIAGAAHAQAPKNVSLTGLYAEAEVALAEVATAKNDARAAKAAWTAASDALEPLAREGRLPVPRAPLLDRARAHR